MPNLKFDASFYLAAALDWIDAIPADLVDKLPAMPGFDRDGAEAALAAAPTPATQSAGQEAVAWRYRANGGPWELVDEHPLNGGSLGPNEECEPLGVIAAPVNGAGQKTVSGFALAEIGRKHFGNPIPQAWYAAARHLLREYAAPVNGGEREPCAYARTKTCNCPNGQCEVLGVHRAADAQQVAMRKIVSGIEKCHTGMAYGDEKRGHMTEYTRGYGDCLAALKRDIAALTSPAKVGEKRLTRDEVHAKALVMPEPPVGVFAAGALASPAKVGGDEREAFDWLETEISAVSCWYHGTPSYEHDANWMKDQALQLVKKASVIFGDKRAALSADGGEDKLDAERYRWLRHSSFEDVYVWDQRGEKYQECGEPIHGEKLDEFIDAAIAANQARKGE